MRGDVKSQ
uniref:Uncharacterized protein n=1 Tax=Anguilla anguilla TaxID=7936 RepID=A0A0E9UE01_ANGAN